MSFMSESSSRNFSSTSRMVSTLVVSRTMRFLILLTRSRFWVVTCAQPLELTEPVAQVLQKKHTYRHGKSANMITRPNDLFLTNLHPQDDACLPALSAVSSMYHEITDSHHVSGMQCTGGCMSQQNPGEYAQDALMAWTSCNTSRDSADWNHTPYPLSEAIQGWVSCCLQISRQPLHLRAHLRHMS